MILKTDRLSDLLSEGQDSATKDPLVIVPTPDLNDLRGQGSASVDLRLGTWFTHLKQAKTGYLSLTDKSGSMELTTTKYVPFGQHYILHPQSFVLAVTLEWISLPGDLAAYVVGKSSWGRCGLIIATAVGVHPGFKGCLTLELTNVGEIPIEMQPGIQICQLFIHRLESSQDDVVGTSSFGGLRRPLLKPISLDSFAEKLSKAYSPKAQSAV
ncbi:MAG: dCTP deaminase [Vulcanimicrobiaceae bacterium]